MDEVMTTREAAAYLGVGHSTVRGYVRRGLLPVARRINARLSLVSRADVERIEAQPPRSGPRPRKERQP